MEALSFSRKASVTECASSITDDQSEWWLDELSFGAEEMALHSRKSRTSSADLNKVFMSENVSICIFSATTNFSFPNRSTHIVFNHHLGKHDRSYAQKIQPPSHLYSGFSWIYSQPHHQHPLRAASKVGHAVPPTSAPHPSRVIFVTLSLTGPRDPCSAR